MVAGIDYNSTHIDVVYLAQTDRADWLRIHYAPIPTEDSFTRARRIADVVMHRDWWDAAGVDLIALEDTYSRSFAAAYALGRVQGALLAVLPRVSDRPRVIALHSGTWKRACGLGGNAKKTTVRDWVFNTWPNMPENVTQDALDAYAIAYAARQLDRKEAAA